MNEIVIDHYSGFEGEPELKFVCKINKNTKIIRIWEGYFDKIMTKIEPNPEGWSGLAYYYHLDEGWYEESPWEIPNLELVIEQLSKINSCEFDESTKNVFEDLLDLLRSAQIAKVRVTIEYF